MKPTKEQLIKADKCLPEANIDSPPYIQVPVPDDQTICSLVISEPEEVQTMFHLIEFKKVKYELRTLEGEFIKNGYKYIIYE